MTRQDEKVISIRGNASEGSSPQSSTQPVARKISGAALLSPRVVFARVALACTEGGIKALADAAELSRAGDAIGAEHLREAAELLFIEARGALDRLHSDI